MAFTNVIRRAASGVIPSAFRATGCQRYYHHQKSLSTLFSTAAPNTSTSALPQDLFRCSFSTSIQRRNPRKGNRLRQPTTETSRRQYDDALVKVIDSQIHCAGDSDDNDKVEDVPESFPFKIEDGAGQQTVTLTRNDHGESITVEVHMPDLIAGDESKKDDGDDSESYNHLKLHLKLHMVVRVSKNVGACFEFGVSTYSNIIEIETLSIKDPTAGDDEIAYVGPDFGDLDEKLQKAFYKYLDIRGINHRSTKFLYEYTINKDAKEYVGWLKKAKKFVEVDADNDGNKNNVPLDVNLEKAKKLVEADADNDDNKHNVPLDVNLEKAKKFVEADADNDDNKNNVLVCDNLASWTVHKTKLLYYHNASTGESTYEKPAEGGGDNSEAWTTHKLELEYYYNTLTGESTYLKPKGRIKAEMERLLEDSEGWTIQRTELGSVYYFNVMSGESTYKKPDEFEDEMGQVGELEAWKSHTSESGSVYYYNVLTGEATFDKPDGFKASTEPNRTAKVEKEATK